MAKKPEISTDLLSKIMCMMFSDFENERNNAASLFVRTFKNADIKPSDIKLHVYADEGNKVSQILKDMEELEQELDDALSGEEAALSEVQTLRTQIKKLEKSGVSGKKIEKLEKDLKDALQHADQLNQSMADLTKSTAETEKQLKSQLKILQKLLDAADKKIADNVKTIHTLKTQREIVVPELSSLPVKKIARWKLTKGLK